MRRTLVTGFEPFGPWRVNSSWEGVQRLARLQPTFVIACLPVDYDAAAADLGHAIEQHRPDRLLLTGLADRSVPTLETRACVGPSCRADTRPHRAGRWNFDRWLSRMRTAQIPAKLSSNAGRYVCETTYWTALGTHVQEVAFLHLPPLGQAWSAARLARVIGATLR
ncbi:MAG: hypothetical protein AAF501_18795 [Pseudomonadota bacterium]